MKYAPILGNVEQRSKLDLYELTKLLTKNLNRNKAHSNKFQMLVSLVFKHLKFQLGGTRLAGQNQFTGARVNLKIPRIKKAVEILAEF